MDETYEAHNKRFRSLVQSPWWTLKGTEAAAVDVSFAAGGEHSARRVVAQEGP